MDDVDCFPDFDLIDERDSIKILFFLIMKTDNMTKILIEINLILNTVKVPPEEIKIIRALEKIFRLLLKLYRKGQLEESLKEEGFIGKCIEKIYLKKYNPNN